MEEIAAIRKSGRQVADYLAQKDMFGGMNPTVRSFVETLDETSRSARRTAAMIHAVVDHVEGVGDPRQARFDLGVPDADTNLVRGILDKLKERPKGTTCKNSRRRRRRIRRRIRRRRFPN